MSLEVTTEDIEVGDEILIDPQEIPKVKKEWINLDIIKAEVTGFSGKRINIKVWLDENDARKLFPQTDSDYGTGYTYGESIISVISRCGECKCEKVYHDKKEEYFCPFCENDIYLHEEDLLE